MRIKEILKSELDSSINIVYYKGESLVEARLVQRKEDQLVIYVSSHNGCAMACRFCHLTQSRQTRMDEVSVGEYLQQIVDVWRLKSDTSKINTININFMSRGEPLLNSNLYGEGFYDMVIEMFKGYHVNFNISSIIPKGIEALPSHPNIRFYYSLYSVNEAFRKKWLPKAMEPRDALKLIKTEAIIHGAFIEGENDSEEDVENMIKVIVDSGVKCRFNVVAYNPFSRKQGEESSRIKGIARQINERISVQKIPKVGFDVKASCGMFV